MRWTAPLHRHHYVPACENDGSTAGALSAFAKRQLLATNGRERTFRLRPLSGVKRTKSAKKRTSELECRISGSVLGFAQAHRLAITYNMPLRLHHNPCDWCSRVGRYKRRTLIERYGADSAMPDVLNEITACESNQRLSVERCEAYYVESRAQVKVIETVSHGVF